MVAQPLDLVDQWALEQGYYSLGSFGVGGFLYAAANDASCTPIPLEKLPGIEDFANKLIAQYAGGAMISLGEQVAGTPIGGVVRRLSDYYWLNPLVTLSMAVGGGSLTALPFTPGLTAPAVEPSYQYELSMPSGRPEDKSAIVARFADWLYTSQANYDTVLYGQEGVDFSGTEGRFAPLLNGKPALEKYLANLPDLVFLWPGAEIFGNTDYLRLPSYTPENIETLVKDANQRNGTLPAETLLDANPANRRSLDSVGDDMRAAADMREKKLADLLNGATHLTQTGWASAMESLKATDTDWLAAQYGNVLKEMANEMK